MRFVRESDVTAMSTADLPDPGSGGVWTLSGNQLIITAEQGPATILVPSESVLLLTVDLPLASRAKRLEALPFAIEDRIADPIDSVHVALGAEVAPKRYLVGVVRHERMMAWVDRAEAAAPGHAWHAAGQPPALAYGDPLPAEMQLARETLEAGPLADRLAAPVLDLRQGRYARRARAMPRGLRRLAWIVGVGALAHASIAAADTLMLNVIADRREADTRALVTQVAPGTALSDDVAGDVADLLPSPQPARRDSAFLPLVVQVSTALAPMAGAVAVQSIRFEGRTLVMDIAPGEPGLRARIGDALRAAGVRATVRDGANGVVRVQAGA
jgi:general secretion pathway protein L